MGCLLKANGLYSRTTVGAVLLAAGAGSRLGGRPKALLELGGVPLVMRQLVALSGAGVDEVVLVLGHHADSIEAAVSHFPISIVRNPKPDDGQASSVRIGLQALSPRLDAVMVTLADQPLIDAQDIVALIDEANAADSAQGNVASTKGTSAQVKDFGKQMMRDHHTLRKAGQDMAKKENITPAPPANDSMPAGAQKMHDSLNAMAKGAAWDKAYIDNEVAVHQMVLALLQTAQGAAQDTALKALIITATPNIQAHLAKAQDIQGKLAAAPAAAGADAGKKKKAP